MFTLFIYVLLIPGNLTQNWSVQSELAEINALLHNNTFLFLVNGRKVNEQLKKVKILKHKAFCWIKLQKQMNFSTRFTCFCDAPV